jgi:hypothetical protein
MGALGGAVTQHSRGCASGQSGLGECDCWLRDRKEAIDAGWEILNPQEAD